jgi:hypothetical protein
VHDIAVASAGNVYTAEVNNGRRVQRFVEIKDRHKFLLKGEIKDRHKFL